MNSVVQSVAEGAVVQSNCKPFRIYTPHPVRESCSYPFFIFYNTCGKYPHGSPQPQRDTMMVCWALWDSDEASWANWRCMCPAGKV